MKTQQFVYVGYADGKGTPEAPNWKLITDTEEARAEALAEGYTAFSILSLSHESQDSKSKVMNGQLPDKLEEPLSKGPLVLDFDYKEDPKVAIELARKFVTEMAYRYGLNPDCMRYWLSGNKGCHIEIHSVVLGSEEGHPYLHMIYKNMVYLLQLELLRRYRSYKIIDMQMYCSGKGRLLRVENIKRENGRYKVPVTSKEFLELDLNELDKLADEPRLNFATGHTPVSNPKLTEKYAKLKDIIEMHYSQNVCQILESMCKCSFFNHCIENAISLSEPEWWAFISNLAPLGELGRQLAHMFSQSYPAYSSVETDRKFDEAQKANMPKTCSFLCEQGWADCPEYCDMRAPCNLFKVKNIVKKSHDFIHREDGLYYTGGEKPFKVCSPIKVIGRGCEYDYMGWSVILEVVDLMAYTKHINIAMRDLAEIGSKWLGKLLSAGLVVEPCRNAIQLLREYITHGEPECELVRISERIGWTPDGNYLLPDKCYGTNGKVVFSGDLDTKFRESGTLEGWRENVGKYCAGNSILELATSYALTGPLLALVDCESGGLHLYGGSSQGKSTIAIVAGSVCGGGQDGFIHQWRTTDNALEKVAAGHNDNLLVLDEVSQVSSQALSNLAYMLPNQKGKMRMRVDGSNRRQYSWNLNFLSTGELTIADKITEDSRLKSYAGQEVRIIDLPVDGGTTAIYHHAPLPFTDLHGVPSTRESSELLKKNARATYGTPMRVFIEKLVSDKEAIVQKIREKMSDFIQKNLPEEAGGQVQRVLRKFALIAAAGEIAIEIGIFPYEKGSVTKAAQQWFRIWLADRHGVADAEMLKAINRLREHLENSLGLYWPIQKARCYPQDYPPREIPGFSETDAEGNISKVYVLWKKLEEICGPINKTALVKELAKRGWVVLTKKRNVLETISLKDIPKRVVGIVLDKIC